LLRFGVTMLVELSSSSPANPTPKDVRIEEDLRDLFEGLLTTEDSSVTLSAICP